MKVKRKEVVWKEVEVEEAVQICKKCDGRGEIRWIYGPPSMRGQYRTCRVCSGKGYLTTEDLEVQKSYKRD